MVFCAVDFKLLLWCGAESYVSGLQDAAAPSLICGNKMPTRCNKRSLLQILLLAQHVLVHYYAHHQELKSIIQWLLPVVFCAVVFKLLVWCGAEGYVSGLQDATARNTTGSNHCIILLSS